MSDNSFSSFPPSANSGKAEKSSPLKTPTSVKEDIRVLKIPRDFQAQTTSETRIQGEVTRSDPQTNRVTIRTSYGDIELQLPPDRQIPQRGEVLQIKLYSDNGAQIRISLEPLQQTPAQTDQDQVQITRQQSPSVKTYQPQPQTSAHTNNSLPQTQPAIIPNQPFKLTPLPPGDIPKITAQPPTPVPKVILNIPPAINTEALQSIKNVVTPAISSPSLNTSISTLPPPPIVLAPSTVAPQQVFSSLSQTTTIPVAALTVETAINPVFEGSVLLSQNKNIIQQLASPTNSFLVTRASPDIVQSLSISTVAVTVSASSVQVSNPSQIVPTESNLTFEHFVRPQTSSGYISLPQAQPTGQVATIIGYTDRQQPVLHFVTPFKTVSENFFVIQNGFLPTGTILQIPSISQQISISNQSAIQAELQSFSNSSFQQIQLQSVWPVLSEFLDVLQQISPQALQAVTQLIPSPQSSSQLPPALLFFIAALKGADINAWIGERPLDILKRAGKSDIISRLTSDFSGLSRISSENLPHDWRGLIFPMLYDGDLKNITLYYKPDSETQSDNDHESQTRFIFDMDLSRMGAVQIDSLFKSHGKHKRLDIILRTEAPLSDEMKQIIRQNYSKVSAYDDLSGNIQFQFGKEDFIKILNQKENVEFMT